jgi:hypothetical protein
MDAWPAAATSYELYSGTPGAWVLRASTTLGSALSPEWSFQLARDADGTLATPLSVFIDIASLGANGRFTGGDATNTPQRAWMLVERGQSGTARAVWSAYAYDAAGQLIGAPARLASATDADFAGADIRRMERVIGSARVTLDVGSGGLAGQTATTLSGVQSGDLAIIDLTQAGGPGMLADGSTFFEGIVSGLNSTSIYFMSPGIPAAYSGLIMDIRRTVDIIESAPQSSEEVFFDPATGAMQFSDDAVARGLSFEVQKYIKLLR